MSFATDAVRLTASAQSLMDSPVGPILLVRTPLGLAGTWFVDQKYYPEAIPVPLVPDDPLLRLGAEQLGAYFDGRLSDFDLPLDLLGTPFQRSVWQQLLRIGHGELRTYGDIARTVGTMAAVRAVGSAVGKNPLGIIVPCHRVIGADGSLTGYAGGLHRKRALLALEGHRHYALETATGPSTRNLFEDQ